MFKVAVGHSEDPDSIDATKEAIEQCTNILQKNIPNAGILFASPVYDHASILNYLDEQFPGIELIGCTSCAELSSGEGHLEESLVLTLFCSDRVKIYAGVLRELSKENNKEKFEKEIEKVLKYSEEKPKLCMTFPEVFTVGLLTVLKDLEAGLGEDVPVVGGGASDMEFKFIETKQFYKTEVLQDSAPFLIFSGPLRFSIEASSGCQPFSPEMLISEYKDNVIYKIGEYTALDFYKHYLGTGPTLNYPLAIFSDPKKQESFCLRTAMDVNEQTGAVTVGADLPEVTTSCSIARADPDTFLHTMGELVAKINETTTPFSCTFITSCAGRQAVLGTKIKLESAFIKDVYSLETPCFGFYSYGQMSPLETGGTNLVHNQSVIVLAMGEEDGIG